MNFRLALALGAAAVVAAALFLIPWKSPEGPGVRVFAAASFAHVLEDETALIKQESGLDVVVVSAASSTLARQISEGAPADVFITADKAWLADLEAKGAFQGAPVEVARNRLVLAFRPGAESYCEARFFAPPTAADFLGACPYSGKVATGDPAYVPLGKYAKEAIDHYGWNLDLAPASDARAALALLDSGAAGAGLLYRSDVTGTGTPYALYPVPEAAHQPIAYWGAVVAKGRQDNARKLLDLLKSDGFATILQSKGFEAGQ